MDSHSRSASPREPSRPQHRPPSPPSPHSPSPPAAFDNRAYQHDESDPNHNDSFTSNGQQQQNGHSKEPNGDAKALEAVNLELINLTPKNGSVKQKKDVEVDMNASNPYDEYFVPVNEHRKYMRGEKLYVTADKRGEKGGCKRPLCWTLLGLVVAAIVALIVLAATGILFTNSPTPVEPYNASVSSARALGGIGHVHDHDHDHVHDHDHDHQHDHEHDHNYEPDNSQNQSPGQETEPIQEQDQSHDHNDEHNHIRDDDRDHSDDHSKEHEHTHNEDSNTETPTHQEHGPETQSDEGHEHSVIGSEEPADSSMYVPRTMEGELKIDNEDYVNALQDPESEEYREFVAAFTDGLQRALFDRNTLENGDHEIAVEVVKLRKGSVIVTYRIHWKPKPNAQPTEDLLTANILKMKLNNYLADNNRMINVYHIAEDKMATRPVLDLCQVNKNDCEYGCEFDETTLDFTCTCPQGQMLDMNDLKKCVPIFDNPEQDKNKFIEDAKQKEFRVLSIDSEANTMRSIPEEEKPNTENVHIAENDNVFDWKETHHKIPEPTTEPDSDLHFSHIFGQSYDVHETQTLMSSTEHESHPVPEPNTEPTSEPEPTAEPKSAAEQEPQPEPTAEPKAEPEPIAEPKSESESDPKAEPEPTAEPISAEDQESVIERNSEETPQSPKFIAPEPTAEPKPEPEPEPTSEPEPNAEPQPHEPGAEQASKSEQTHSDTFYNHKNFTPIEPEESEPTSEPEPTHKPHSMSESHPTSQFTIESEQESEEHAPTTEAKIIPESKHDSEKNVDLDHTLVNEENYDTKSNNNMNNPIETTTMRFSISEPNIINEPTFEPKPEIISILSGNKQQTSDFESVTSANNNTETSTDHDLLSIEDNLHDDKQNTKFEMEDKDITDKKVQDYLDMINHNINQNLHESEQRSFKKFDNEFEIEATTDHTHVNDAEDDISFDTITKENEVSINETTTKIKKEESVSSVSTSMYDEHHPEDDVSQKNDMAKSTTVVENEPTQQSIINISENNNNTENMSESAIQDIQNNQKKETLNITTPPENKSANLNKTTKLEMITVEPEIGIEYSISKHIKNEEEEKNLLEALKQKNQSEIIETSTPRDVVDEGVEVTFDAINMLYNRSSKSIENQTSTHERDTTETNLSKDTTATTDSDWLSETVTEVNYEETMNKMEKHETTESPLNKMDEIMNSGMTKDDFEPDYLNNMGSTKMNTDQYEPLYGMVHDYENEDSRVKRVHSESKENSTETITDKKGSTMKMEPEMVKETTTEMNMNKISNEMSSVSYTPVETTTISEYIYKAAEKVKNETNTLTQNPNKTMQTNTSSSFVNAEPAPVWEESEKDITKESPHVIKEQDTTNDTTENHAPITSAPTTVTSMLLNTTHESESQNMTKLNNFNVTIYEISSHGSNQSQSVLTNSHSAEYEDHETEMNPFLPEVENNKSLVKKLQEGHDLEPTNLNETQNENVEEHIASTSEGQTATNNETLTVLPKEHENVPTTITTTEDDTLFNELLMNVNSNSEEHDSEPTKDTVADASHQGKTIDSNNSIKEKSEEKDILPISTFLIDTDDLDRGKQQHGTENKSAVADNNLKNTTDIPNTGYKSSDDGEYLSVVPIEHEDIDDKQALKNYKSESIQQLNDISDSPKKSDRRTLDATKLDSVINNEA